eukprot:scaffold175072_cov45-Prasinocladus_malaysianus.AAC.3
MLQVGRVGPLRPLPPPRPEDTSQGSRVVVRVVVARDLSIVAVGSSVCEGVQWVRGVHEGHHGSAELQPTVIVLHGKPAGPVALAQQGRVAEGVQPRTLRQHGMRSLVLCESKVFARLQHHQTANERVKHPAGRIVQARVLSEGHNMVQNGRHE